MLKSGEWAESGDGATPTSIQSTMFPPTREEAEQLHLERWWVGMVFFSLYLISPPSCSIRILPHLQNTGGFFVAVLQKHRWLPWQHQAKRPPATSQVGLAPATSDPHSQSGDGEQDGHESVEQAEEETVTSCSKESPTKGEEGEVEGGKGGGGGGGATAELETDEEAHFYIDVEPQRPSADILGM